MNHFRSHCASNLPFYCNFASKGADWHSHSDFYEFCLITSGTYQHIYQDEETTLDLGQLLFFSPGESHSLIENTTNSHHYSFIVQNSFFREYVNEHISEYAEKILSTPYRILKLSGSEFAYLTHLASPIVRSAAIERLPIATHFLYNALFSLFVLLPEEIDNSVSNYAIDLLRRIDSYHLLSDDVNDMYNDYPVSSTTLIRDFKKLTGKTIVQYRNAKRMEYAAHLLEEENYPITMIANMLNISSLGYFSKQFQSYYGMTPKQYQLRYRKNTNATTS